MLKRSVAGMMGVAGFLAILAAWGIADRPATAEDPKIDNSKVDKVGPFMRAKLEHAQKVLEGLATEDFEAVAKHSQEMSLLSQATVWQVFQTPEYSRQSVDFRRAVDLLTEAAKEKNLDGATLAYMQTTMRCVSCHKYVRKVRDARIDLPESLPDPAPRG